MKKLGRFIMFTAITIVILLGVMLVALRWMEPHLLYYPTAHLEATPGSDGWAFEDVALVTTDGATIHGWYVPAPTQPAPFTVLFCHGNAGNISHRLQKLSLLRQLGVNTLIIDYRGYGRSTGTPSEAGTYADARAAYEWLTGKRNVPANRIVVFGESLGAAVATDLATQVPVAGLIMEEPFTSVPDVAAQLYWFLPVRWLVQNKYDNVSKLPRLKAPLLILHSRQDEMFSWEHPTRLLAAAPEPKTLVELQGGHNDAFLRSYAAYEAAVKRFLGSISVIDQPPH